jgi:hypothetical protein
MQYTNRTSALDCPNDSRPRHRGRQVVAALAWSGLLAALPLASAHADFPTPKLPTGKLAEVAARAAGDSLTDSTVVDGLREMLRVGTSNAVAETGRADGYLKNDEIRVELPDTLEGTVGRLRKMQLGSLVDDLEVSMNRAAEQAAAEAQPVFDAAIEKLSFADGAGIVAGGERAATDFFEAETREQLAETFRPIVEKSMEDVGVAKVYDAFVKPLASIPFFSAPKLDLTEHITDSTLDGLFSMLAKEEGRMRKDPGARTAPLIQGLFRSNP